MNEELFSLDEKFLASNYPDYAFYLYKILKAYNISEEKGIRVAKETVKTSKKLSSMIEKFQKYYANADDYVKNLYDVMFALNNKTPKKQTTYLPYEKATPERTEKANIVKNIYESGLSMLDYFFYNPTPLGVSTYFNERCHRQDKSALEIKRRENTTYSTIIDIINKINNKELDYVEYFEITKLNPYHLIAIAKENNLYTDELAKFINLLRTNKPVDVERELNGVLVINEEVIPRKVKEQAIEYLNSINAPMDVVVYDNMVRRLIKKSSK